MSGICRPQDLFRAAPDHAYKFARSFLLKELARNLTLNVLLRMASKYRDPGAQGSETSEIETYGKYGVSTVKIVHPCFGRTVKGHLQKHLSLKEDSLQLFAVFLGGLDRQIQVIEDDTQVPIGKKMSFARFNGDRKLEAKLIQRDDVALHLLFSEAKHAVDTGVIEPTDEQRAELEDYLDPMFPVERQYLELVQECQGYGTFVFPNCLVNNSTAKTVVKVTSKFLIINNEIGEISYHHIKSWNFEEKLHKISFDVNPTGGFSTKLMIESDQVSLISQAVTMYCHSLAIQLNILMPNLPQKSVGRYVDPLVSFVNQLYKPRASFDQV